MENEVFFGRAGDALMCDWNRYVPCMWLLGKGSHEDHNWDVHVTCGMR